MESTFIIDCPDCKAKVAAVQDGETVSKWTDDGGSPGATRITVGRCPSCGTLLAGKSDQIRFENIDSEYDEWSDAVRVYPKPERAFSSRRIPKTLRNSLVEGNRSLQANANIAACVMFGRALEALCRDHLVDKDDPSAKKRPVMLGAGIKQLKEKNIIDDRLYDWSQHLQAFRNLGAHPDDEFAPSRRDTEDFQAFVYAIIEYVYDLTDRYNNSSTG
jgi:hypothetical protein